jgi:putative SOS response-associated peptidase YedK
MCGRYAVKTSVPRLARLLLASSEVEFEPRYNVAPTDFAPVCRHDAEGMRIDLLRWGLVPHWTKDVKIGTG